MTYIQEIVTIFVICSNTINVHAAISCANGYLKQTGDIGGRGEINGRGGGEYVNNCDSCADLCSSEALCKSYECSPSQLRCNLNDASNPTLYLNEGHEDYIFCTKDECPNGYYEQIGDIPGRGEINGKGGGQSVSDCDACSVLCSSEALCKSYECSPSEIRCNLNYVADPTLYLDEGHTDYIFCTKEVVPTLSITDVPTPPTSNPNDGPSQEISPDTILLNTTSVSTTSINQKDNANIFSSVSAETGIILVVSILFCCCVLPLLVVLGICYFLHGRYDKTQNSIEETSDKNREETDDTDIQPGMAKTDSVKIQIVSSVTELPNLPAQHTTDLDSNEDSNDDQELPSLNKIETMNSDQLYERNQDIYDNETETKHSCMALKSLDSELLYESKEGDTEGDKILETLYKDVMNSEEDKMDATTKTETTSDPIVILKLNKTTTGAQSGDI